MMLAFSMRRIVAANIALASVSAVSLSACQGSSSTTVVQCGAPAFDAQGPGYQTLAGGSVSAEGVSATFCNAGVQLVDDGDTGASPPDSIFLTISSTTSFGLTDIRLPAGAVSQGLNVTLGLPKVATGTYASTDSTSCGSVEFSYSIPNGSEVDCSAASAQTGCPTGCTQTFTCPDAGVFQCCVPLGATYIYQASGAALCGGGTGTQTALGSWSLNLTSVDRYSGDAGLEFEGVGLYVAHGSLSAKLQGTADTTETIDLALSF